MFCRTFQEVLHNEVCMNLLEEFLQSKGEESLRPLEFWLTVERLKKQANMKENNYGETLEAELTIDDVHQTFFTAGANRSKYLLLDITHSPLQYTCLSLSVQYCSVAKVLYLR